MMQLSQDEILRYSRHLIMPEVGVAGQTRLKQARVLCIGAGGLGAPVSMYLAAAGVGQLGLVDHDRVEISNLQRQILHATGDVGRSKLDSARDTLAGINPTIDIRTHWVRLTAENAIDIIQDYDIVVDGTDNFPTRYLVSDACAFLGKPNIYGAVFRFEGQATVFDTAGGPCYRCLYPEPPPPGLVPDCAVAGVLGVMPGIIGCIQALETIKRIIGQGDSLLGRLLLVDALAMRLRTVRLRKNPDCPVCGDHPTITELIDYEQFCGGPVVMEPGPWEITAAELKTRLERGEVELIDVREPHELEIARLGDAQLIPLSELRDRVAEIPADRDVVLICHAGIRSLRALEFLREEHGLERLKSLHGGINAWSVEVDPAVPRY